VGCAVQFSAMISSLTHPDARSRWDQGRKNSVSLVHARFNEGPILEDSWVLRGGLGGGGGGLERRAPRVFDSSHAGQRVTVGVGVGCAPTGRA